MKSSFGAVSAHERMNLCFKGTTTTTTVPSLMSSHLHVSRNNHPVSQLLFSNRKSQQKLQTPSNPKMKYSSVSAIFALLSSAAAASNENDTVASSKVVFLRGGNKLPRAHVSWGADDDDSAMKMHGENYEDDELEVNAAAAANDNGTAVASSKDKLPRAHISSGVDDDDSAMKMHGEDYEDGLGVNDYKNKDKAYKDGPNTKMPLINGYKDKAYKDGPNTKMPLINGYKDKAYKDGPNTKMPLMYELGMSNEDYELEVNVNKEVHGDGWDISGAPTDAIQGMNDENDEE